MTAGGFVCGFYVLVGGTPILDVESGSMQSALRRDVVIVRGAPPLEPVVSFVPMGVRSLVPNPTGTPPPLEMAPPLEMMGSLVFVMASWLGEEERVELPQPMDMLQSNLSWLHLGGDTVNVVQVSLLIFSPLELGPCCWSVMPGVLDLGLLGGTGLPDGMICGVDLACCPIMQW